MSSTEPPPSSEPPISETPASDEAPAIHEDEDREAILARRALFVAGALASMALTGCDQVRPDPCLSATVIPPDGATPEAADAAVATQPDAGTPFPDPTIRDAGAPDAAAADAGRVDGGKLDAGTVDGGKPAPKPCLTVLPPQKPKAEPQPCLSVVAPEGKK